MAWLVSEGRVLASAEVAPDRRSRARGLLGRGDVDGALVIEPCRWVHTIGMRFAIDVAYLDAAGVVVKTVRMHPRRLGMPVLGARWVVEAAAGAFARWGVHVGTTIEVRGDREDTGTSGAGTSWSGRQPATDQPRPTPPPQDRPITADGSEGDTDGRPGTTQRPDREAGASRRIAALVATS